MMILQIVQPLYGGVDPQPHLGQNPNVSSSPFLVNGVHALPVYGATPFQEQPVTAYGGSHFQGGPYEHPSQLYVEPYHGPIPVPKVSGHVFRARGRGKGRVQQKRAVAPGQDPKLGASSFSQTQLLPSQAPAPVLPPPKAVICELCKVECNTLEIFQQHANGKKHQKKLKAFGELQNLNRRVPSVQMPTVELKTEVVPQPVRAEGSEIQQFQQEALPSQEINGEGTKVAGEKRKAGEVEPSEEPDKKMRVDGSENPRRGLKNKLKSVKSKKKKTKTSKGLVQAPKPKEVAPLVCELCNVKCESVVVFQSHLAGKKHISKAKSFLQGQATFGPAIQAVDPSASSFIGFQHANQGFSVSAQNVYTSSAQGDIMRIGETEGVTATTSLLANS